MALREAFAKLIEHTDLSSDEASAALDEVVSGEVPPALIAAFLVALRMKGETSEEIAGLARTMRAHALAVALSRDGIVDTCGTGGDGRGTLNISTMAALVVAGAGAPVAKHGNRALSSKAGSADVLEALGVKLECTDVARCLDEAGIAFLFAPAFHPAIAAVMPVRRELGVRTVFNVIAPMLNPARPDFQLLGVGVPSMAPLIADALHQLGIRGAWVVHGAGGTDELTLGGENLVLQVTPDGVVSTSVTPGDAGLPTVALSEVAGGTPDDNASVLRSVLAGERGAVRDHVVFNAAAALVIAGIAADLREGVERAASAIDSGAAAVALQRLVSASNA